MSEHRQQQTAPAVWHFPVAVEDVAETGGHFDLVADAHVREGVARLAGLRDLPRLQANFAVTRQGAGGLRVAGRVSATVGQTCVVTLEPLVNEVEELVDLVFVQPPAGGQAETADAGADALDETEPLLGGTVDLGAVAIEFLILGIDPYPRKPGAVFQPPLPESPNQGPFTALAALKSRQGGH
jgi:uncharacterized metal-binding protein YceD (DUF177 family)